MGADFPHSNRAASAKIPPQHIIAAITSRSSKSPSANDPACRHQYQKLTASGGGIYPARGFSQASAPLLSRINGLRVGFWRANGPAKGRLHNGEKLGSCGKISATRTGLDGLLFSVACSGVFSKTSQFPRWMRSGTIVVDRHFRAPPPPIQEDALNLRLSSVQCRTISKITPPPSGQPLRRFPPSFVMPKRLPAELRTTPRGVFPSAPPVNA